MLRYNDTLPVAPRTAAANGNEHIFAKWIMHDANANTDCVTIGNRCAAERKLVRIVGRTIERVNVPS